MALKLVSSLLTALSRFASTGILVWTGSAIAGRTITRGLGTHVTNGSGVSGDPVVAFGNSGGALADPGADRIPFWDDSATGAELAWLSTGTSTTTGLLINGTNFSIDQAFTPTWTAAHIWSGAAPQITFSNATSNWIQWPTAGVAAPAFTTRSVGTRLVLYPLIDGTHVDYAFGINTNTLWSSVPLTTDSFKWYGGTTLAATLTGEGDFTLVGDLSAVDGTFSGIVTVPNTGLHLLDTNASHDLIFKPGSDLSADKTLTFTTGDADRTLDISAGSVTISVAGAALIDDADSTAQRATLGYPNSSTDNTIPRFNGTAGAQQTSGVTIDDSDILVARKHRTVDFTLADDTASSFALAGSQAAYIVVVGITSTISGIAQARVTAGVVSAVVVGGASFAVSTGVLAGTTGVDGNITISPHTDGNIYIENRVGATRTFSILAIGGS